jgi:Alpha/beta hydrolase domain
VRTAAERQANNDPRLSLEERYGNAAGYVAAVTKAAADAVKAGFLLPVDAEGLIKAAQASAVLK